MVDDGGEDEKNSAPVKRLPKVKQPMFMMFVFETPAVARVVDPLVFITRQKRDTPSLVIFAAAGEQKPKQLQKCKRAVFYALINQPTDCLGGGSRTS